MAVDQQSEDARVERYRVRLERLAEMAMVMAESLMSDLAALPVDPQAADQADPAKGAKAEIMRVFTGLTRAVARLAAVDARLTRDAQRRKLEAERDGWRTEARLARKAAKDEVRGVVQSIILHDAEARSRRSLERKLHARLDREDDLTDGAFANLPFAEALAKVCHDLGLSPHWARLQDEPWAQDAEAAFDRLSHHQPLIVELVDFDNPDGPGEIIVVRRPSG